VRIREAQLHIFGELVPLDRDSELSIAARDEAAHYDGW
jgi:hypothetical protein